MSISRNITSDISAIRNPPERVPNLLSYTFASVDACNMCGALPDQFRLMGLRLNRSQGVSPKRASGIAVSVKKCRRCELIFADPQPMPASLSDHYGTAEEYWSADYFEDEPGYFAGEIAQAKLLLGFREGMRALDVGAGIGKAMKAMTASGFETYGFEPGEDFRAVAIERTGIPAERIALATVETAEFPPAHFDFISFGAVLEHLQSPSLAIERALTWLKPGGVIQIEVPSSRHLIPRFLNLYYCLRGTNLVTNISPMHSPFHLYEFGLKSFNAHGRRAGYVVAHHATTVCTIYHFPRFMHPLLRWYMERTGTGMQLSVYLRKGDGGGLV